LKTKVERDSLGYFVFATLLKLEDSACTQRYLLRRHLASFYIL